jgi:hypothetical protein
MRALGYVIAAYGVTRLIGDGSSFAAEFAFTGRMMSIRQYFYVVTGCLSILGATGAIVGGVGCIARRPWARYPLVVTAIVESIWRIALAVRGYYEFALQDLIKSPDTAHILELISQVAYTATSLVFAVVLLVIVRNKNLWVARDPA